MKHYVNELEGRLLLLACALASSWTRERPVINGAQRDECWWDRAKDGAPAFPKYGASVSRCLADFSTWNFAGKLIDQGYCVQRYHGPALPRYPWAAHFSEPRSLFSSGKTAREALLRSFVRRTLGDQVEFPTAWAEFIEEQS